jgi:hypothetical protein
MIRQLTMSEIRYVAGAKLPEEDLQDIARSKRRAEQEEFRRKRMPEIRFESAFQF